MDGFHHELSEDDMILSQVLETLEDEMELRNVNIEDFFGEFPSNVIDENASGDLINTSAVSFDLGLDLNLWLQVPSENGKIQNVKTDPRDGVPGHAPCRQNFFRVFSVHVLECSRSSGALMPYNIQCFDWLYKCTEQMSSDFLQYLKKNVPSFKLRDGRDEKPKDQEQGVESRFAEMTDNEIDTLIEDAENKNTKKATKWAVNVYEDWKNSKIGSGLIIPNLKDLSVQDEKINIRCVWYKC
ncbi:Hypothetical predicted protein [Mytilus galloprovincialis]|uniref:Uncharacterized protein n=1 Tax=Mytilus galloprovincialis TaxID=29158 RepID=A0A8B6GEM0_MYTGA|nr:Hypothetical predicted protein [Mytilus galloprovincialis]